MINIDKWVIIYIIGYVGFVSYVLLLTANADFDVYEMSAEQRDVLNNPSNDAITLLTKFGVLTSLDSGYMFLGFLTGIMTLMFILAVAIAINEFVPFT